MTTKSTPDGRYTVTREYCGYEMPRYVFRFCGTWVSSHDTEAAARTASWKYHSERMHSRQPQPFAGART